MAPLTRISAGGPAVQPDYAAKYYSQRSTDGGLIIAEATNITESARGVYGAPGIFTQEQIDAWKPITQAVHDKGGIIFLQLWHTGRLSHPSLQPDNVLPVSSSTNMPIDESRQTLTQDGMFLFDGINDRTDQYGGSVENRARILVEVIEEVLKGVDSSKVGVRLSPYNKTCNQQDPDPATMYKYVFEKLSEYDLAYAHIVEPRGFHYENELTPKEGATKFFRQFYKGVYMMASGFERNNSIEVVENGDADIVASSPTLIWSSGLN
ncbi:hypothetical protein Poli38472_000071 [Pythium oligandrum]|uniref:NADH:flavin oxidoreductase/NADH oxidase N-terminal domain-containing protein n=1 Tax=Pythium oligandrum TaxID=41045 RepID=A0A8K1FGI0_PYTOL|nr:hypothetical protein Poli38472_000071 [Pythium oligandrum]|eukprot:TMW60029.1 hypothetical protein Poli38472_000071 [Pythium oligandrum]